MRKPTTPSVADLVDENVRTIQRIESELHPDRSAAHRLAERLFELAGGGTLLWLQVAGTVAWLAFNLWPGVEPFDPYPFALLAVMAGVEAIFLAILILMSQRHAMLVAERRSQLALQINLLTEQENTKMLVMLQDIAQRLGLPAAEDADVDALKQQTQADTVAESIARAEAQDAPPRRR